MLSVHQKGMILRENQENMKEMMSNVSRRQHFIDLILIKCLAGARQVNE